VSGRTRWLRGLVLSVLLLGALFACATAGWRWTFSTVRDDGRLSAWVNRRPERLRIEWSAVESRWPGRIEIEDLRISGRTERRLWEVTAERAEASLAASPLLRRELRFDRIRARGVVFRATGRTEPEAASGAMARLPQGERPSIVGFPDLPLPPPPGTAPWSYVFRDARLEEVREIWIDDRILVGQLRASVGFELRRRRTATIYPSSLDLRGAEARVGGEVFARGLEGDLRVSTSAYEYRGADLDRVLGAAVADLDLSGDLEADPFVDALLAPWPTLELDSGAVHLDGRIRLRHGRLAPGTRIDLHEPLQRIRFVGFEARGDATVRAEVRGGAAPTLATTVTLGSWELGRPGEPPLLLGEGLQVLSEARQPAWGQRPDPLDLTIDLGSGRVPDLRFLNDYLPAAAGARVESGAATIRGKISVAGRGEEGDGEIALRADALRLDLRGQRLEGKLEADLRLGRPDLEARRFAIGGTRILLREFAARTSVGGRVAGWWGEVRMTDAEVALDRPVRFGGSFRARLADTRPLIAFYEVKRDLPNWAERLLTLEGVSASGAFDWAPGRFELYRSEVPLPRGELRTKLLLERDRRLAKLLARWRRLELGMDVDGSSHRLHLRDVSEWYAEPGFVELDPP